MKKYKHLFFDLDGTLWDLQRNTRESLQMLFEKHGLQHLDFDLFLKHYFKHNDRVWKLYRENKIEKSVLRVIRFTRAFTDVKHPVTDAFVNQFADDFIDTCPKQPHLVPGTLEMLNALHGKVPMHIITNGFREVQGVKMKAGGITAFFQHIINSEDCGVRKPYAGIFQHAMKVTGAEPATSLMIGDDWEADILGARDFGMDQAWLFNGNSGRHFRPTYQVKDMHEVLQLFADLKIS